MFWTMRCVSLRNGFEMQRWTFNLCVHMQSIPNVSLNNGVAHSNLIFMCISLIVQTHQPFFVELPRENDSLPVFFGKRKTQKSAPSNVAKFFKIFATWTLQHFKKHLNPFNIGFATFSKFATFIFQNFKIFATITNVAKNF